MNLETNPHHRLIVAPGGEGEGDLRSLPMPLEAIRWAAIVVLSGLFVMFLIGGTMESRVTFLLTFLLAVVNPVWGLFAVALMGPLFLLDQAKTHMLATLEVLVIGMMVGELRLLGRGLAGSAPSPTGQPVRRTCVYWGLWPHYLVGLSFLLFASSLVGLQLMALREQWPDGSWPQGLQRLQHHLMIMFYGPATDPSWTGKSLWNWTTGMVVAVVAARRMDALATARWMKLGGLSLLAACGLALLSWSGIMDLSHIRRPNPDPLQVGRLQGLAGHPGWFGQWIVLMWPGLLLWWSPGRTKRNMVIVGSIGLVGVVLMLTAARAAWLGVGIAGVAGVLYLLRTFPWTKRILPIVAIGTVLTIAAGIFLGGETLERRVTTLLRVQDRANYYVTGTVLLREHPMGIGLGTHYRFYEWTFTPFYRWYQTDHVTAHSMWLHALIENGPFVPFLLLCGVLGVFFELYRSRGMFNVHDRTVAMALALGLLGMLAVSIAQYLPYLRVVELCLWAGAGMLVGLCRQVRCRIPAGEVVESARGRRLLLACGLAALVVASMNAGRVYTGALPRHYDGVETGALSFWTGSRWETPVNDSIEKISFSLYRRKIPASGTIHWPDGTVEAFRIEPEEHRYFEYSQEPGADRRFAPAHWLRIEVEPLWVPAHHIEDSTDNRGLGVYVSELRMERPEE